MIGIDMSLAHIDYDLGSIKNLKISSTASLPLSINYIEIFATFAITIPIFIYLALLSIFWGQESKSTSIKAIILACFVVLLPLLYELRQLLLN